MLHWDSDCLGQPNCPQLAKLMKPALMHSQVLMKVYVFIYIHYISLHYICIYTPRQPPRFVNYMSRICGVSGTSHTSYIWHTRPTFSNKREVSRIVEGKPSVPGSFQMRKHITTRPPWPLVQDTTNQPVCFIC